MGYRFAACVPGRSSSSPFSLRCSRFRRSPRPRSTRARTSSISRRSMRSTRRATKCRSPRRRTSADRTTRRRTRSIPSFEARRASAHRLRLQRRRARLPDGLHALPPGRPRPVLDHRQHRLRRRALRLPHHAAPPGQRSFSEADLVTITCNDAAVGIGNELNMVIGSTSVVAEPGDPHRRRPVRADPATPSKCTGGEAGGQTTLSVQLHARRFRQRRFPGHARRVRRSGSARRRTGARRRIRMATASPIAVTRARAAVRHRRRWAARRTWTATRTANESELPGCLFVYGTNPGGCPDPDNDGIQNAADKCWNVPGIAARRVHGPRQGRDPGEAGQVQQGAGQRLATAARCRSRRPHPGQLGHVRDGARVLQVLQVKAVQGRAASSSAARAAAARSSVKRLHRQTRDAQPAPVPAEGPAGCARASGPRGAHRPWRGRSASTRATPCSRATG